ncbi:hypothetical protein V6N11_042403 [Hibiscus sabdariffa]|uniref:RNase H type-1 domain-containing protein n=1 Tax=Hibiscus sabdariffa TaxID=183260 RepID=A0ABR2QW71_9ROSI
MDPSFVECGDLLMIGMSLVQECRNAATARETARLGLACRREVELETDCVEVERILVGKSGALSGNAIVDDIREMLSRNWVVVIRRISRDGNKVVDALAAFVINGPDGVRFFDSPPLFVSNLLS